jgi:hypothetical protein
MHKGTVCGLLPHAIVLKSLDLSESIERETIKLYS